MKAKLFLSLAILATSALAIDVITGPAAERLYHGITGAETGPFCTGLAPAEASCTWMKRGSGASCAKTVYSESGRTEYRCNL